MSTPIVQRNRAGVFVVNGSKHNGKTLDQVAEEDIGYLAWVYEKKNEDLDDETNWKLQDVLKAKKKMDDNGRIVP